MLIAVPSKGRAGRVTTQAVLPSCALYVPLLEVPAYQRTGGRNVVAVPNEVRGITATRNWILRSTEDPRVVMIDDDVKTQGWRELLERASTSHQLDEAGWLAEFRKLFELTEQLDYRIWGVATDGAGRAIYPYNPFRFRSYVTASCMGLINDGRTYFDESYLSKEDYELCARCISEDGGVVCAQYLYWVNLHYSAGGVQGFRTQTMEVDCIRRLRRAYPGLVRVVQRKTNDWAIEIAA
ncbi:MAG TPA: hypothetical protein VLN57_06970 [Xanthobacteraceae bacterium]|nr:hypothetical protein [Xanthobacteraceae bacterium]